VKQLVIPIITFAFLGACGSSPKTYGPAYGSDFGYRHTQIEQDRFRISYTSRSEYESRDFALLRAAQIAQNEGYSHFKIIGGNFQSNGPNPISGHLGVGLSGGRHNGSHVDVGVHDVVRAVEGHKATETIEVILLSNPSSRDRDVYSAESVMKNIVPPQSPKSKAP